MYFHIVDLFACAHPSDSSEQEVGHPVIWPTTTILLANTTILDASGDSDLDNCYYIGSNYYYITGVAVAVAKSMFDRRYLNYSLIKKNEFQHITIANRTS